MKELIHKVFNEDTADMLIETAMGIFCISLALYGTIRG